MLCHWQARHVVPGLVITYAETGEKMNTEAIANSKIGQLFIRTMAAVMESRLRYRFFGPLHILQGADIHPGQAVLELGCGTGFFTLTAAGLIGNQGSLVAMDVLPASVEAVSARVRAAHLNNVRVVQGDALETKLEAESMDAVLLFGILPAPMLPLDRLLPEMHRILKPGGVMAIWPPSWVSGSIPRSGLFTFTFKRNGVFNFKRS
jgi:ubiquinone/menaquinone biosynthesis C-methylase UbiE